MDDLYEGLTTESPSGAVDSGRRVELDVSASGTQYTFQLRPEAQWSNGNPVRAQDFMPPAAARSIRNKARPSPTILRLILNAPAIIAGKSRFPLWASKRAAIRC